MASTISGRTRLVGLLGWPVAHSLSPAMQNAAAAQLNLDLAYIPLPVHPDQLVQAVQGLIALGFLGANVTVPHKEAVIPLLDQVDEATAAIGAVNTIVIERTQSAERQAITAGYNTDWSGFLADLSALAVEVAGRDALILGAGGSARAVAYALSSAGSRVHLFARRQEQARLLLADLVDHCPPGSLLAHAWTALNDIAAQTATPALIVNCTPVGMTPHSDASPWPTSAPLPKEAFVYDLVYNPAETKLMQQARAAGCQVSNGLGMLVRQGALAFQLWTGVEPDLDIMAKALGHL